MIGCLYFLQEGKDGAIKIGWTESEDASKRLAQARLWNYRDVTLLATLTGYEDSEKLWHSRFAKYRLAREWFSPHPELLAAIEAAKAEPVTFRVASSARCTTEDVRRWIADNGMTIKAFAQEMGYNPSTISGALSDGPLSTLTLRMAGRIEAVTRGQITAVGLMKSQGRHLTTLTERRLKRLQAVSA